MGDNFFGEVGEGEEGGGAVGEGVGGWWSGGSTGGESAETGYVGRVETGESPVHVDHGGGLWSGIFLELNGKYAVERCCVLFF